MRPLLHRWSRGEPKHPFSENWLWRRTSAGNCASSQHQALADAGSCRALCPSNGVLTAKAAVRLPPECQTDRSHIRRRREGAAGLEDGTAHFLGIAALRHGYKAIRRAGGFPAVDAWTGLLARRVLDSYRPERRLHTATDQHMKLAPSLACAQLRLRKAASHLVPFVSAGTRPSSSPACATSTAAL